MHEKQEIVTVRKNELVDRVRRIAGEGYRLVQICCTKLDQFQIDYSFDKEYKFVNLRILVPINGTTVPSVSGVYWGAFTFENEIHDLFGVKFEGLNVDYGGNFYRIAKKAPFSAADEAAEGKESGANTDSPPSTAGTKGEGERK